MHLSSTRAEFLRLRVQGLSLASIGRRLGVSKPTLIKWNRQSRSEIALDAAAGRQRVHDEVASGTTQEIADLTRRLTALKQELFSRAVREISTPDLEALAGQLRQRLDSLKTIAVGTEGLKSRLAGPSPIAARECAASVSVTPNPSEPSTESRSQLSTLHSQLPN